MLLQCYTLILYILNIMRQVEFYCCYGNKYGNLSKNACFNFIYQRRLARIKVQKYLQQIQNIFITPNKLRFN